MALSEQNGSGVVGLWRYPIKSMQGEETNALLITERGVVGDRTYAITDLETGKIVSAKNPRKWGKLFDFQAAYVEQPEVDQPRPSVIVTLPDGRTVRPEQDNVDEMPSTEFARSVVLTAMAPPSPTLEEYWPDIDGLANRETVTDEAMPSGTFFDLAHHSFDHDRDDRPLEGAVSRRSLRSPQIPS